MKGFGNLVNKGSSFYKFNDTTISQSEFNKKKNIFSFFDNKELSTIFGPIVNFYEKLKTIYQNRRNKSIT